MYRANHQIQPLQDRIRQVEFAVVEDVDLDPLQDCDARLALVEAVDLVDLLGQAHRIEAARHRQAARMLGHRNVLQPAGQRRLGHRLQRVVTIAVARVQVQVAAQVASLNQPRQTLRARRFDFAAVFAQLGLDVRQPHGAVDRFLGVAGDALAALEHAVLVDLQAAFLREAPQCDVVRLRAGEVSERGAEAFRLDDAQVDLQAAVEDDAGTRRPRGEHLSDVLAVREALDHRAFALRRREQVEIADRLAPTAQAAGRDGLLDPRHLAQRGQQRHRRLRGLANRHAARLLGVRQRRLEDRLLGLRPEAGDRLHPPLRRGLMQFFDRVDTELMVQRPHALGTEARHLQQLGDRRRQLLAQPLEQPAAAGVDDLGDARGEVGADAGQPVEIGALGDHRLHAAPHVADRARRVAIGADAKRIGAFDLEQVGDFAEDRGDFGVLHGHWPLLTRAGRTSRTARAGDGRGRTGA